MKSSVFRGLPLKVTLSLITAVLWIADVLFTAGYLSIFTAVIYGNLVVLLILTILSGVLFPIIRQKWRALASFAIFSAVILAANIWFTITASNYHQFQYCDQLAEELKRRAPENDGHFPPTVDTSFLKWWVVPLGPRTSNNLCGYDPTFEYRMVPCQTKDGKKLPDCLAPGPHPVVAFKMWLNVGLMETCSLSVGPNESGKWVRFGHWMDSHWKPENQRCW